MNRNPMHRLYFLSTLCFFAFVAVFAQAPEADLDSITEDAYQRMQKRQALERGEITYPIFVAPSYDSDLERYYRLYIRP